MAKTTEFVVMTAAANMPNSCWGRYGRVAVVEVDPDALNPGDYEPRLISEHARGVVRVVETWERQHIGTTDRCAFAQAVTCAEDLATRLTEEAVARAERLDAIAADPFDVRDFAPVQVVSRAHPITVTPTQRDGQ